MMWCTTVIVLLATVGFISAEVYLKENFDNGKW